MKTNNTALKTIETHAAAKEVIKAEKARDEEA